MTSTNFRATLLLCLLFSLSSQQKKLNFGAINNKLKQLCFNNPNNYINSTEVKCNITYEASCWKETPAGQTVVQPCPFLFFSAEDSISRRCDEQGNWQRPNITNCRILTDKEAVEQGRQAANVPAKEKDETLTHSQRVKRVYVAISWVAFVVLLPTFILICIVMSRENERFTLHKNLILAFLQRLVTLFIFYYEEMGEKDSKTSVCNAFWLLSRYFTASEITWMLNEGIFLLRMLVYPFDNESYLLYYYLFGWGFSGVLTFCVYLPYMQFKIARVSASCWAKHNQSLHMLVLYVPLTIMLLINFGVAAYVVQMLTKKLKNSHSSQMNTIKKSAKAVVVLISVLGFIYLLTFYKPENNPSYDYFVAVVYPLQGVMVCIFCVFLSVEFREALRRRWMKWRYGILIDTNPYSMDRDNDAGTSGEQEGATASVLGTGSSEEVPPRAFSIASLRDKSSDQFPKERPHKRSIQMSLLSRSSDLTKYRAKVEPEPLVPLRVQSAGPGDWFPPMLEAVRAWGEVESSENPDESNVSQVEEPMESQTSSQAELETETKDEDTRESLTPQQSEDQVSFSSQQFDHVANLDPSPLPDTEASAAGGETLTAATAGSSTSQDDQPSTSTEESNVASQGNTFWDKARQLATQRRRSRMEHNRVFATEGDSLHFRPTQTDRFKQADEYRLAWITNIIKGNKSHENESDA
ncbi:Hormone receptor domain [Desmophyllum pertusum]|uniref:Hormone receptor domain n=1 Tax=Desmophyllum pertusum TaxID=174260 RepID=A0A9X0A1H2_9CNID|nr:Hormone receptor domain [Desmophyllum pertusum]